MKRKSSRLYSLFRVETQANGRKRYVRISEGAFPLDTARRLYQDKLIGLYDTVHEVRELRPVND